MFSLSRRIRGTALTALAVGLLAGPLLLQFATPPEAAPSTAGSGLVVALAIPASVAAGAVLLVSGGAAMAGHTLSPRWSLTAPIVAVAVTIGANAGMAGGGMATTLALAGTTPFVAGGALVGAALAPIVLGSIKGDTVALVVGTIVALAAVALAPASAVTSLAGVVGGGGAIGVLWVVDGGSWRP